MRAFRGSWGTYISQTLHLFMRPASTHPAMDNVRDARKRQEALTKMKEAFEMTLAGEAATEKPQGNWHHSI